MEEVSERIEQALRRNEERAERIANRARLSLLVLVTLVVVLNLRVVWGYANLYNFSALGAAYVYGLAVLVTLKRNRYRPAMKYITSMLDVTLVCLVLLLYTTVEIPSVALKNPAFLLLFPLIALTIFRHDPKLTAVTGGCAVLLYGCLWAYLGRRTSMSWGGYWTELFTPEATIIGQATKLLILAAFVIVAAHLARDTRVFLQRLVRREVKARCERQALERELELASAVQAQLLPRPHPPLGGLHLHGAILPGRYVGGDYYDFIPRPENTVLLVVADVAGKGIPAALTMSAVRASVHLFSSMNLSLRDMLARLNELVHNSTSPDAYVTLFAAEINTVRNTITYVNAGHTTPLLVRSDGGVSILATTTVPVGLFPVLPCLQAASEEFCPGSTLVACTDGIWERSNSAGELYGERELVGLLTGSIDADCAGLVGKLLAHVKEFGGKRPFEDDATVAVARFESAAA